MSEEKKPKVIVHIVESARADVAEDKIREFIKVHEEDGYTVSLSNLTAISTQANIVYRFVLVFNLPDDFLIDGPPE